MDELLERLRSQVEQATPPIEPSEIRRRRTDRSRRANRVAIAAVVAVLVGAAAVRLGTTDRRDGVAGNGPSPVSIEAITVRAGDGGAEIVIVELSGPLPRAEIEHVDDITTVFEPSHLLSTGQGPSGLHVCQHQHWFGEDSAVGSVDLLIPSPWFAAGTAGEQPPVRFAPGAPVHKMGVCGPYRGYVQVWMWGPPSDEPEDIDVSVSADRTRVTVEIRPEAPPP